mgnify:CR=1 FL=1
MSAETVRRFVSRKTVASRHGVHPETVYRLVRDGKFPKPIKFSPRGACRWPEHVVDAWEAEQLVRAQQGGATAGLTP